MGGPNRTKRRVRSRNVNVYFSKPCEFELVQEAATKYIVFENLSQFGRIAMLKMAKEISEKGLDSGMLEVANLR